MNEILEIARENHLGIIEDAAHAPGAKLNGNYLGTLGDIGCFSFFSNKNLVTGEGGMLVTEQNELAEKIRLLRSHAMTSQTWERYKGHAFSYDVAGLGYNYRIDEIRSAMGLVQLNKLIKNNSLREKHTRFYWKALEEDNVSLPFYNYIMNHNATSAFHIFPILLPADVNRSAIMGYLREKGIQTSIHYPPIHQFSYYKELLPNTVLPTTEEVARHEMTLPLYPSMNRQQSELVVDSLRGALESSETKLTLKQ
jgi:dTDP-4-amino-4,6-dideoxygalactose transaminase